MSSREIPEFLPNHTIDPDYLVVGLSPSSKKKLFKNGTFARLLTWFNAVNMPAWDFFNIITVDNSTDISLCDENRIKTKCENRKKIIALGGTVSRVLTKYKIDHYKIDHPSPRNRNLNDKEYEKQMLIKLKEYIHGTN